MPNVTAQKTFPFEVPGIGGFTFRARKIRDEVQIQAEASRIMGGPCDATGVLNVAVAMATLSVLLTEKPEGFSIDDLDPLDGESIKTIFAVYGGLRTAEDEFRKKLR